jgi:hypothetical protein
MMGLSQLRIELVVATGIVGASLIAATLSGCQTDSTSSPGQGGLMSQFNRSPNGQQPAAYGQQSPYSSANGMAMAQNGAMQQNPSMSPYAGMTPANGMSSVGSLSPSMSMAQTGYPDNRQAFMTEAQRIGAQQGLSAQDVVAMSRSGMTDQQIALAVSQRGEALRSTPGVGAYLAQNGVNPAVLNGPGMSAGSYPAFGPQPFPSQMGFPTSGQAATPQAAPQQYASAQYGSPQYTTQQYSGQPVAQMSYQNAGQSAPYAATPATGSFPTASAETGPAQGASYDSSSSQGTAAGSAFDQSASAGSPAQSWRPMAR